MKKITNEPIEMKNRGQIIKKEKMISLSKVEEVIDRIGSFSCGFIDSSDNLCDRIDPEELKKELGIK